MIVLFSSLSDSGIFQMANQLLSICCELKKEVFLFVPQGAKKNCNKYYLNNVVEYVLPRTINPSNKEISKLAQKISTMQPSLFVATDDAIRAELLLMALPKEMKKVIYVHDVLPHLQHFTFRKKTVEKVRQLFRYPCFKVVSDIFVLSENSLGLFKDKYPRSLPKVSVFPLGAHVLPAESTCPSEMKEIGASHPFILFFGRVDQYKGVDRLMEAYYQAQQVKQNEYNLVIAGRVLQGCKYNPPDSDSIISINRYISDGELVWLFEHCRCVVLPYYEASQSGVLPIAYKFGKPVIVSEISGLKELVVFGQTGAIFSNTKELEKMLSNLDALLSGISSDDIKKYYAEQYDWTHNVRALLLREETTCE